MHEQSLELGLILGCIAGAIWAAWSLTQAYCSEFNGEREADEVIKGEEPIAVPNGGFIFGYKGKPEVATQVKPYGFDIPDGATITGVALDCGPTGRNLTPDDFREFITGKPVENDVRRVEILPIGSKVEYKDLGFPVKGGHIYGFKHECRGDADLLYLIMRDKSDKCDEIPFSCITKVVSRGLSELTLVVETPKS